MKEAYSSKVKICAILRISNRCMLLLISAKYGKAKFKKYNV